MTLQIERAVISTGKLFGQREVVVVEPPIKLRHLHAEALDALARSLHIPGLPATVVGTLDMLAGSVKNTELIRRMIHGAVVRIEDTFPETQSREDEVRRQIQAFAGSHHNSPRQTESVFYTPYFHTNP